MSDNPTKRRAAMTPKTQSVCKRVTTKGGLSGGYEAPCGLPEAHSYHRPYPDGSFCYPRHKFEPMAGPASTGEQPRRDGHSALRVKDGGWLMENGEVTPKYIGVIDGALRWTDDSLKALRLARRADAEALAEIVDDCWRIVEHVWCGEKLATPDGWVSDVQRKLIGNLLTRWELMTNDFKSVVDEQERDFYQAMHELVMAVDRGEFWPDPQDSAAPGSVPQAEPPNIPWSDWAHKHMTALRNAIFATIPEEEKNANMGDEALVAWPAELLKRLTQARGDAQPGDYKQEG